MASRLRSPGGTGDRGKASGGTGPPSPTMLDPSETCGGGGDITQPKPRVRDWLNNRATHCGGRQSKSYSLGSLVNRAQFGQQAKETAVLHLLEEDRERY